MKAFDHRKYRPFPAVEMPQRHWPNRQITSAPQWCAVDLRDGNQALVEPMSVARKTTLFRQLVAIGFKQVEVGFPAASEEDFSFVRQLIEHDMVPEDVTIQVLTPAREELIARSFEALRGARQAIVHLYNSTSTVQRQRVFKQDRRGIIDIAVAGARAVAANAAQQPQTRWQFQYSPESFTGTELDFAVDICNAVNAVWQPSVEHPVIINLPATVELSTPNVYADQVEWFCDQIRHREALVISLHTHNDRGCAVAAAELGLLAGADRIEGTLLGNGERTGNMDIVTCAMNLYSQGVDPGLDLSHMDELVRSVEDCTGIAVHPRHPYAGELVFTAFSGSHQDAIRKCLAQQLPGQAWDVAYLPIDPGDVGRSYQELIRINSQSGKGGIAWVLEQDQGIQLPRWLQIEFSSVVQRHTEQTQAEIPPAQLWQLFHQHYLLEQGPWRLDGYRALRRGEIDEVEVQVCCGQQQRRLQGSGSGVVDAFVAALATDTGCTLVVAEYSEHTLGHSNASAAMAYVQLSIDGRRHTGVARSDDIVEASMLAILAALNRSHEQQALVA
jgi:2-isopropylmalate synthase